MRYGLVEEQARQIAAAAVLESAAVQLVEIRAPAELLFDYAEVDGVPLPLTLRSGRSRRGWWAVEVLPLAGGRRVYLSGSRVTVEKVYERAIHLADELRAIQGSS